MDKKLNNLLEEEIRSEIQALTNLDSGSNEKSMAIDNLVKLYKLKIEEAKNEWDISEKIETHERDEQFKNAQLLEQVKDRYVKIGLEIAGIILPLIFYASWMRKGFRFEETGTYTSTTFRGLFNRFKPTRK